jgi:sodium-dependent phosphate cotransporter
MRVSGESGRRAVALIWLAVLGGVYLLLVAVGTIAAGFDWAAGGAGAAGDLFQYARNPFMALVMGAFATALVQSSSTVTSVIVALVAAGLPVATAVPMVMGANIGTTVTNTLVSLGHMGRAREFRRAFAAATVHDFFNVLSVVVFLPLELAFGFLDRVSAALVGLFLFDGSVSLRGLNVIGTATKPVVAAIGREGIVGAVLPGPPGGTAMIVFGIGLLFLAIRWLGALLKRAMVGRAERIFHAAVGRGVLSGLLAGALVTILVQSSSTTTSLIVPLAGAGLLTLDRVYPFTLGANIGTCVTSLLAATAITGDMAAPALQIALVHLLYNTLGVVVIYGTPGLRRIPLVCAEGLAGLAETRKTAAVAYMVGLFFAVPAAAIGISSTFASPAEAQEPLPGVRGLDIGAAERDAAALREDCPDLAIE